MAEFWLKVMQIGCPALKAFSKTVYDTPHGEFAQRWLKRPNVQLYTFPLSSVTSIVGKLAIKTATTAIISLIFLTTVAETVAATVVATYQILLQITSIATMDNHDAFCDVSFFFNFKRR